MYNGMDRKKFTYLVMEKRKVLEYNECTLLHKEFVMVYSIL